jgi:PhoPQ-activated pathogenicity-related protein
MRQNKMKKIFIVLLILIFMSTLIACGTLKIDTPEAVNAYSHLTGSKGLELYVWTDTKTKHVCCGLLEGTNRHKNEKDYKIVLDKPVTVEKMAEILGGYSKDMFVIIIGLGDVLSQSTITVLKSHFDKLQMPNIIYPQ